MSIGYCISDVCSSDLSRTFFLVASQVEAVRALAGRLRFAEAAAGAEPALSSASRLSSCSRAASFSDSFIGGLLRRGAKGAGSRALRPAAEQAGLLGRGDRKSAV